MLETAIVGAGPYGLSVAAHFRHLGIPFRIFGRPMDSWLAHMPKGMMLKSDGFASNIYDPDADFTLKQFCAERGIEYSDLGLPVGLETFSAYGLAFQERMVPELEDNLVVALDRTAEGFVLGLDNGEAVTARRVVLAVGITHFEYVPPELAHLPSRFFSNAPMAFHYLPQRLRLHLVSTTLGPSGGWFIRDKVIGRVPLLLGYTPQGADIEGGRVRLHLRAPDGTEREVVTEHVIAATGYKVDLERLSFLSSELRSRIKAVNRTPVLSSAFESSIPGLYFVGIAAANSFGPVMRFAFGAGFAARTLTRTVLESLPEDSISIPVSSVVTSGIEEAPAVGEEPALRS